MPQHQAGVAGLRLGAASMAVGVAKMRLPWAPPAAVTGVPAMRVMTTICNPINAPAEGRQSRKSRSNLRWGT